MGPLEFLLDLGANVIGVKRVSRVTTEALQNCVIESSINYLTKILSHDSLLG